MAILEPNKKNIELAVNDLKRGEVVAFPTETVYGLGADGLNETAVAKIFEVKQRPTFNPLILHVSSFDMLNEITNYSNSKIKELANNFWPGPLTMVLNKKDIVPYIVTSGLDTVAVRMPNNKIAIDLINKLGKPIAAPSANRFSNLSPTKAKHVENQLGNKIKIILNGGPCEVGLESTIISITDNTQKLLRPGGIPKEDIENIIGPLEFSHQNSLKPNSPGQLEIHYAPTTPISFFDESKLNQYEKQKVGILYFNKIKHSEIFIENRVLSEESDFREAASNLFSFLHEFEQKNLDLIVVERIPEKGLGIAIMDRLTKAVNKYL